MLKQRIVTACILITVVLAAVLFLPANYFALFIALAIGIGSWEWTRLAGIRHPVLRILYLLFVLLVMWLLHEQNKAQQHLVLIAGALWWMLAFTLIRRFPKIAWYWRKPLLLAVVGLLVLLPGWTALLQLRDHPNHQIAILLLLGLVAAADIGAYFTGKRFGKHKLAPLVSPNKTWEGACGGMLACVMLGWGVMLFSNTFAWPGLIDALGITLGYVLIACVSIVGDLFESLIKRQADMKDSGSLLPGHGGVLDRIDGITAALPLFVLLQTLVPII